MKKLLPLLCLCALAACEAAPEQTSTSAPRPPSAAYPAMSPSPMAKPSPLAAIIPGPADQGQARAESPVSGWLAVADAPVSTFAADVDTASYAFLRRVLMEGRKPLPQVVRVEEMVNYFPYDYVGPQRREDGFASQATVVPSPWKQGAKLLHVGIKGWEPPKGSRPRVNLTFLVDVSGSMQGPDRLPLVQASLRQLVDSLRPDDHVALVTYANGTAVPLPPTAASEAQKIIAAIDALRASGGTYGAGGLETAYAQARSAFDAQAVNRVILATDGDFNLGANSPKEMEDLIAAKRGTGIYLTVLGVGMGNLNDSLMQRLAQAGNGQAAYLDSILEARKVLVHELNASMLPIADDVKIQVEFNPAKVAEYRLIGYETRALTRADFNNDRVDAGEIGAGHRVTAIYEFLPVGVGGKAMDDLRYGPKKTTRKATKPSSEYAFVKLRHKVPGQSESRLSSLAVGPSQELASLESASDDVRFAVAVAGFGQILRGQLDTSAWDGAIALARGARGADPQGWRSNAVELMEAARRAR